MQEGAVILTGGAGFIGSHIAAVMLRAGFDIIMIDDFSNSTPTVLDRLEGITKKRPHLIEADLASKQSLDKIREGLSGYPIWGAVHMAGLKAVGESVEQPTRYYDVNINTTLNLIQLLTERSAGRMVYSSSATVYGSHNQSPVNEDGITGADNPYGRTKLLNEQILADHARAFPDWRIANLRYFNPAGAHPSGTIGEDPKGIPNNLFPYIAQVAVGRRTHLNVFGNDYPTKDGTGVRDYIHVMDLAEGHLASVKFLMDAAGSVIHTINLGTGIGYSVLDVVEAFSKASGRNIPVKMADRRPGDIAKIFAAPDRAETLLGWKAKNSLEDMCADHWRWQSLNPDGYDPV